MSLFGSKKVEQKKVILNAPSAKEPKRQAGADSGAPKGSSFLCPGIVLEGELKGNIPVYVEGTVKGKINTTSSLTIGPNGIVEAEVSCASLVIEGVVNGNVHASESIRIESAGKLIGDIWTKSFTNQPGGFFEGYSHMQKEKSPSENGREKSKK